jgi:tetratricopeptide (TPR) repeat protein
MESYETEWLAGQPVLLAIMRMVGLFDRPASGDCLNALRAKPAIQGLTNQIVKLDDGQWERAIARLREVRLLAPPDSAAPDAIDAHPLVREWFGERLRKKNNTGWKAAHGRLYKHLRDTTEEGKTPSLEDLAPLYQAIAHGCRAGRYQEALHEIYVDRICRRRVDGEFDFYAGLRLGALGTDFAAMSWFFEKPYEVLVKSLDKLGQSWVLFVTAFCLRAQGRFAESLTKFRAGMQIAEVAESRQSVALIASHISETELLVGAIGVAVIVAKKAIEYAEHSDNIFWHIDEKFWQMDARTSLADALHAAGRRDEVFRLFVDAERRQRQRQPDFPLLYSLQGYRYCDVFLAKGDYVTARDRAMQTVEWDRQNRTLRGRALDTLVLARAYLGLALGHNEGIELQSRALDCVYARMQLADALDGLRRAETTHYVPRGLLARAVFRRSVGDWDGAARNLDEVEEIAEPGPMRLYLCDMALERARLAFAKIEVFAPLNGLIDDTPPKPEPPTEAERKGLQDDAAKQIAIAADYIEKCGYHRRDEEFAELEAVLKREKKFSELPPRV